MDITNTLAVWVHFRSSRGSWDAEYRTLDEARDFGELAVEGGVASEAWRMAPDGSVAEVYTPHAGHWERPE